MAEPSPVLVVMDVVVLLFAGFLIAAAVKTDAKQLAYVGLAFLAAGILLLIYIGSIARG